MLAGAGRGFEEGDWLRADRQTAGRGRQGRGWASPAGNLHASTLVRLGAGDPSAPTLALVAAVALQEAAAPLLAPRVATIKWPNDLMLVDAKLAGILLERSGDWVVAGFGVNMGEAPSLADRATGAVGGVATPAMLIEELAAAFGRWLWRWRDEGLAAIRARWLDRAHPPGTPLRVTLTGEDAVDGAFAGLAEDGALLLNTMDGLRIVRAGDVILV